MISFDKFIVYSCEHRIFYFDVATPNVIHTLNGLPNKIDVTSFAKNTHALYASTLDKFVLRITVSEDGHSLQLVKTLDLKSASARNLSVTDDLIYALRTNGEIDEINALELTVLRSHKPTIDATCITYSSVSKEIWLGD